MADPALSRAAAPAGDTLEAAARLRDDGRLADEIMRFALEAAGVGTFTIDVANGRVRYSRELSTMLGFPDVAETTIEAALARVHRDDQADVRARFLSTLDPLGDGELGMEVRFIRPGGAIRWLLWNGRTSFTEIGGRKVPVHVIGACIDITRRREAEQQLRDSERLLERAQDIAHLGSWQLDLASDALTWSDETYRILGIDPAVSPTFELFLSVIHPDDRQRLETAWKASLEPSGPSYDIEHRIVRPNTGEVRILHEKCEHVRDASGRVLRSIGMVHDVTDQKRGEQSLRDSEERFRTLSELASDWFWEQDDQFRFVAMSESVSDRAGSDPLSHLGKTRWELPFLDVTADEWRAHQETLQRHEKFRNFEYKRITEGGKVIWMSASGAPVFDAEGRFRGYRGTGRNITQRKLAEEKLKEREALLTAVTDSVGAGLFLIDCDDRIRYANRAWLQLLGLDPATDVVGRPITDFLDETAAASHAALRPRVLAGETVEAVRHGGAQRSAAAHRLVIMQPWYGARGDVQGIVGVVIDITDRKRWEERITRLNRELDHRVRNILARFQVVVNRSADRARSVEGFVAALDQRIESMARAHALLSRTQWAGASLAELARVQMEPCGPGSVEITGPEITLKPEAAQALSMVLHELVTNAAKHGAMAKPDGKIMLEWHWSPAPGDADGPDRIVMRWRERDGPIVSPPDEEGYGLNLIRELVAYELGGKVDVAYRPNGLDCSIELPATIMVSA